VAGPNNCNSYFAGHVYADTTDKQAGAHFKQYTPDCPIQSTNRRTYTHF